MKKNCYKNNRSAQVSRQRKRNREINTPRLEKLKEAFGCYECGRMDIPGRYLDGHHIDGKRYKYKALAYLCNRCWKRVVDEILGIGRGQENRGGPVVMVCQRYHEDEIRYGADARPCTHECFKHQPEPYRVKTRLPGKLRQLIEADRQQHEMVAGDVSINLTSRQGFIVTAWHKFKNAVSSIVRVFGKGVSHE